MFVLISKWQNSWWNCKHQGRRRSSKTSFKFI